MRHNPGYGIMTELMNERPAKSFRCRKGSLRRHLDVIRRGRVERLFTADPNDSAAVGKNDLRSLRCAPRRFLDRGWNEIRNAVDLAGMEQAEGAQQRDALHRVFVILRAGIVAYLKTLEEIPGRAALALADLPAPVFRLLVGRPARIAAAESQDGHAERQHVDAAIALPGRRVARHRRTACLGIPWPAPGRRAGFQRGDDPVGDFLIVVAWCAVDFTAAVLRSRCGARPVHRGVLP